VPRVLRVVHFNLIRRAAEIKTTTGKKGGKREKHTTTNQKQKESTTTTTATETIQSILAMLSPIDILFNDTSGRVTKPFSISTLPFA